MVRANGILKINLRAGGRFFNFCWRKEAKFSANQLLKNNILIDNIITSILKRATKTAHIVSEILGFDKIKSNIFGD